MVRQILLISNLKNVWKTVRRICILILGCKGFTFLRHSLTDSAFFLLKKKKKKSTVNYFNNQSLKSKHSGLLTFQGYHSPSLHQLPYYWYKVTALEKEKKQQYNKVTNTFYEKRYVSNMQSVSWKNSFFFISSASLSFWLLFGNYFFSVNFFPHSWKTK